jgi:hypothetical protein
MVTSDSKSGSEFNEDRQILSNVLECSVINANELIRAGD